MLSPLNRSLGPAFVVPGRSIQAPRWPFALIRGHQFADRLIGFWPLYGPTGYSGINLADAQDGIENGTPAIAATTFGNAVPNFSKNLADYIDAGPLVNTPAELSFCYWSKQPFELSVSTNRYAISNRNSANHGWTFGNVSGSGSSPNNTSTFSFAIQGVAEYRETGFSWKNEQWFHAGFTFKSNSTVRFFGDGSFIEAKTVAAMTTGGDYVIGAQGPLNTFGPVDGKSFWLMLWNQKKSDQFMGAVYAPENRFSMVEEFGRTLYFFPSVAGTAKSGTATFAVTTATVATGKAARSGSGTIPAVATTTASGTSVRSGIGTIAASASPAAIGVAERAGVSTIPATTAVSATGRQGAFATPTINVLAAVLASGASARLGTAIITATGSTSTSGIAERNGTGTINALASATAKGLVARTGIAPLNAFATLTATGTGTGAGALDIVNAVPLAGIFDPAIPLAGIFDPAIPLAGIIN